MAKVFDTGYFFITNGWQSVIRIKADGDEDLTLILAQFGGSLSWHEPTRKFYYQLSGAACATAIRAVFGHLVKNRMAAQIMLEYDDYMMARPKRKAFSRLDNDEFRERMTIRNKLLMANGRRGFNINELVAKRDRDYDARMLLKKRREEVAKAVRNEKKEEERNKKRSERGEQKAEEEIIKRWPENEVIERLQQALKGEKMAFTALMKVIKIAFSVGDSYAKKIIRESLHQGYLVRLGKPRSSTTVYGINIVWMLFQEKGEITGLNQ